MLWIWIVNGNTFLYTLAVNIVYVKNKGESKPYKLWGKNRAILSAIIRCKNLYPISWMQFLVFYSNTQPWKLTLFFIVFCCSQSSELLPNHSKACCDGLDKWYFVIIFLCPFWNELGNCRLVRDGNYWGTLLLLFKWLKNVSSIFPRRTLGWSEKQRGVCRHQLYKTTTTKGVLRWGYKEDLM